MYYKNYEDYMRTILGYPIQNEDTYNVNYCVDRENLNNQYQNTKELEAYYPEIYKILDPIVIETCNKYDTQITSEILENMVDEVYKKIENNNISIKINIDSRVANNDLENRNLSIKPSNNIGVNRNINNNDINRNNYIQNDRRPPVKQSNPFIRDLIKIMILNRLLGRGIFGRPPRPHIPPYIK